MTRTVIASGSAGSTIAPSLNNWASGTFGTGLVQIFGQAGSYDWTVPSGITSVRVRVWGAGGGGQINVSYPGGAGGGFAMGTVDLSGVSSVLVTVGQGGLTTASGAPAGGTSSFGAFISATGGEGGAGNSSTVTNGGVGVGGTINHQGGSTYGNYSGGGGAANMWGNGNWGKSNSLSSSVSGYTGRTAGAGGGWGSSGVATSFNSVYMTHCQGTFGQLDNTDSGTSNMNWVIPTTRVDSLDMIGTGSGAYSSYHDGVNGGGGAGGAQSSRGGWPGGGGGSSTAYSPIYQNQGANGCVIVEY